jgi:HEAT repeat protein
MTTDDLHELFQQTLLGDYEDEVPWAAVSKLRSNGSRQVFNIAAGWLRDNEALKRARGAAILAQLRLPLEVPTQKPVWLFRDESYPLLVEMLKRENDPMVLNSGIAALGHLYNPAGIPTIASYSAHPDENVRFSVACALGHFPNDPEAVSRLLILTHDSDSDVRDWAVFGLGVQGDADSPEIRDALMARMTDDDEDVREEALVGLSKRRDLRALPILRRLLEAPELKVRVAEAASAMLGLTSDPEEWEASDYKRGLDETFGAEPATDLRA